MLNRRKFFAAAGLAPFAAVAAVASPARASMGAGRYLDSRAISGPTVVGAADADRLLLVNGQTGGVLYLDDAFPIGSGFGFMKDDEAAAPVFVYADALGIDGYLHVVATIKGMGGDLYRTDDGWRYLPLGPQVPATATLHRTVVAPTPGNSDFIDAATNHGKTVRYNCQSGSLFAVLPDPLSLRWGLPSTYRSAMQIALQRVDDNWSQTLTFAVQGGSSLNGRPNVLFPPRAAAMAYCDGQMWSFLASHGLG